MAPGDESSSASAPCIAPVWGWQLLQANAAGKQRDIRVPSTLAEALAVFTLHPTTLFTGLGIVLLAATRVCLGFELMDIPAAAFGGTAWVLQEWYIHKKLLHSERDWPGKADHEGHHAQPYHHITIDPLAHVAPAMAASLLVFSAAAGPALGQSATLAYWCFGLLYIFMHYIVHTRVSPTNPYWRRVRQHHMQHHCRNEDYWLSFCLPSVDTLMGTNPLASEVPMTAMARSAVKKRA